MRHSMKLYQASLDMFEIHQSQLNQIGDIAAPHTCGQRYPHYHSFNKLLLLISYADTPYQLLLASNFVTLDII